MTVWHHHLAAYKALATGNMSSAQGMKDPGLLDLQRQHMVPCLRGPKAGFLGEAKRTLRGK